jgi:uncharacterized repeat protein (TIGR02543 family)
MPANDITLYAKWSSSFYTLSYVDHDGTVLKTQDFEFGADLSSVIPPADPTRTGYTFSGWDGIVPSTMPTQNLIYQATYSINQYDIEYLIFSDTDSLANISLYLGETIITTALGAYHSSALTSTGRLFIWGYNEYGQLGDGEYTNSIVPVDITNRLNLGVGEKIVSISLGGYHSSALTSTGRIFTWGNNDYGQLGDGTTIDKTTPTDITSLFSLGVGEKITSIYMGYYHSSALTSTGRLFTWGRNFYGELGDGTMIDKIIPTEITNQFELPEGDIISTVSLGNFHSSALTISGHLFTWGDNFFGQIGDETLVDRNLPVDITNRFNLEVGEEIVSICLGGYHSSAITSFDRLFTWGLNYYGQLGDGTNLDKTIPTEITSQFNLGESDEFDSVHLGAYHSSVLTTSGHLFTWGYNDFGILGDGTMIDKTIPIDVTTQFGLGVGEKIISSPLAYYNSSVFTSIGRIFIWGWNGWGQLGDGTTTNTIIPSEITSINTVIYQETYDYDTNIAQYTPTLEGYSFSGWFTDSELTTPYTFNLMPANDVTLYGRWIPIE